jgi:hypothetical protein
VIAAEAARRPRNECETEDTLGLDRREGPMNGLTEEIDGVPNISGSEPALQEATGRTDTAPVFFTTGQPFEGVASACAIALHMHQPLIPAGGGDLATARLISNLQYMYDNPGIGDNHNASVFRWCYRRMGEFVPQLMDEGKAPRVMLEYSGTLLHGLRQMGAGSPDKDISQAVVDA